MYITVLYSILYSTCTVVYRDVGVLRDGLVALPVTCITQHREDEILGGHQRAAHRHTLEAYATSELNEIRSDQNHIPE